MTLDTRTIFTFLEFEEIIIYSKQRIFYEGLAKWNILDESVRNANSLLIFKQSVKDLDFS